MKRAIPLSPTTVLRARVHDGRVTCAGVTLHPLRNPLHVLCSVLAASDLDDCAVMVSYGRGEAGCFIASFRDTARWIPGKEWRRAGSEQGKDPGRVAHRSVATDRAG